MAETPLIVLLGNDDGDGDHRVLSTEIRRFTGIRCVDGKSRRAHPDATEPVRLIELAAFLMAGTPDFESPYQDWRPVRVW